MKCKFKVGDKVVGNCKNDYFITCKGWVGYVTKVCSSGSIMVAEVPGKTNAFVVSPNYFDLVKPVTEVSKIVITTDGKTTTATKYCEDGKKVSATARCAPEDTFDFNVGAKLAMERLMEATETVKPPKYYNGKVVCIKNVRGNEYGYTVGKIYEIVNGVLTDDVGWKHDGIKSFNEWNEFSYSDWLEIKE